jgi:hypothetical protein
MIKKLNIGIVGILCIMLNLIAGLTFTALSVPITTVEGYDFNDPGHLTVPKNVTTTTVAGHTGLDVFIMGGGGGGGCASCTLNDILTNGNTSALSAIIGGLTVNGDAHVTGKLTVDGIIDPTAIFSPLYYGTTTATGTAQISANSAVVNPVTMFVNPDSVTINKTTGTQFSLDSVANESFICADNTATSGVSFVDSNFAYMGLLSFPNASTESGIKVDSTGVHYLHNDDQTFGIELDGKIVSNFGTNTVRLYGEKSLGSLLTWKADANALLIQKATSTIGGFYSNFNGLNNQGALAIFPNGFTGSTTPPAFMLLDGDPADASPSAYLSLGGTAGFITGYDSSISLNNKLDGQTFVVDTLGNVYATGTVTADTYYGDGSNLTGISTVPALPQNTPFYMNHSTDTIYIEFDSAGTGKIQASGAVLSGAKGIISDYSVNLSPNCITATGASILGCNLNATDASASIYAESQSTQGSAIWGYQNNVNSDVAALRLVSTSTKKYGSGLTVQMDGATALSRGAVIWSDAGNFITGESIAEVPKFYINSAGDYWSTGKISATTTSADFAGSIISNNASASGSLYIESNSTLAAGGYGAQIKMVSAGSTSIGLSVRAATGTAILIQNEAGTSTKAFIQATGKIFTVDDVQGTNGIFGGSVSATTGFKKGATTGITKCEIINVIDSHCVNGGIIVAYYTADTTCGGSCP